MDVSCRRLPLREYGGLLDTLRSVVRNYDKLGHRNHKKDANHLCKHAMHLIRLLMMAVDLLEKHIIITCRQDDLPLLMKIRNGEYLREDDTLSPAFYEILDLYERRFREAAKRTTLPEQPDMTRVGAFVERVNRRAVMEEYE